MTDKRMADLVQQIEGCMLSQMNNGVPGPYLPPEYEEFENAIAARIKEAQSQRMAQGRRRKAGAVDAT